MSNFFVVVNFRNFGVVSSVSPFYSSFVGIFVSSIVLLTNKKKGKEKENQSQHLKAF